MYQLFIIICAAFAILMVINIAMKAGQRNEKLQDVDVHLLNQSHLLAQIQADHNRSMAQLLASVEGMKELVKTGMDTAHEDRRMINNNVRTIDGLTSKIHDVAVSVSENTRDLHLKVNNLYDLEKHTAEVQGLGYPWMSDEQVSELRTQFYVNDHGSYTQAMHIIEERKAKETLENVAPEEAEPASPTMEGTEKPTQEGPETEIPAMEEPEREVPATDETEEPTPEEEALDTAEELKPETKKGFHTIKEKWEAMKARKENGASLKDLAKEFGYRDKSSVHRFLVRGEAKYGKK